MDKPKTTPKDFFLWAGAMIALYAGVFSFIALLFDYINYSFPDPLKTYYYQNPYLSSMSYEMASLIVLAPLFLILMRVIRRSIAQDPTRAEIWVRRWALFLILFVAGATIVVDLIVLLTTFFRGEELTTAFLLKVLVVLLVAGGGFLHFMADLWGYWVRNPQYARMVNWGVGVLIILSVVAGFFIVGTPMQARLERFDEQKVENLQSIQSQITYYYQQKRGLPNTLEQLSDPLLGYIVPTDPQTGESYVYQRTATLNFRLCAAFNAESREYPTARTIPLYNGKGIENNWTHGVGEVCFDRTIDPDFYPPTTAPIR